MTHSTLSPSRASLLGLLAQRAVQVAAHDVAAVRAAGLARGCFPRHRVPGWPELEARVFILRRKPCRPEPPPVRRDVVGAATLATLDAALRIGLGFTSERLPRSPIMARIAGRRLELALAIERAFCDLGEGLRWEELVAATGLNEGELWTFLRWARTAGALDDRGELGWFRSPPERDPRAVERQAIRERRVG